MPSPDDWSSSDSSLVEFSSPLECNWSPEATPAEAESGFSLFESLASEVPSFSLPPISSRTEIKC